MKFQQALSELILNSSNFCKPGNVLLTDCLKPAISSEQLKRIKSVDTRVIVLFTHMMYVPTIMRDAFDVGLLEAGYAWLIVDIHEQFVSLQHCVLSLIAQIKSRIVLFQNVHTMHRY